MGRWPIGRNSATCIARMIRADTGADGMTVDIDGRLYVTTQLGLQVLDPLGRVNLVIAKPQNAWLSNVVFGGPDLDTLYVTCGDKVYRRRVVGTRRRALAGAP